MVFGALIDVPLLTVTFVPVVAFRRPLSRKIARINAPSILLCALTAIPLAIFEERVDCRSSWRGRVAVPPTLPILLVGVTVLGVLMLQSRPGSVLRAVLPYCAFGVLRERFFGGLRGLPPPALAVFLAPYVGLGYTFVSMLPVLVVMERGRLRAPRTRRAGPPTGLRMSKL